MSFYDCHYGDFFSNLAMVEQMCKRDRYLHPHYAFYIREMKAGGFFTQMMASPGLIKVSLVRPGEGFLPTAGVLPQPDPPLHGRVVQRD